MLGVLKAGGGFVLLDPSLPQQRLKAIIQQLNAEFIVSSSTNLRLSSQLSKTVIELDSKSLLESAIVPTSQVQLSSTAMFAVFTSGSTGTPKGVVLSHSNFCSGLKYQLQLLGFTKDSRVFDFASYAFDISVHNVFATLISGGCLCIPSESDRRDNISKAMVKMGTTVADLTPSVARLIDPTLVPQLDTLILAGEAVSIADVTRWWGKTRVVNAYGPAECNISTINWRQSSPKEATHIGKGAGLVTWSVKLEVSLSFKRLSRTKTSSGFRDMFYEAYIISGNSNADSDIYLGLFIRRITMLYFHLAILANFSSKDLSSVADILVIRRKLQNHSLKIQHG